MSALTATERDIRGAVAVCPPAFTGRDRELAGLAQALAGPPAVVLVDGEAGIGKTKLIQEYLATEYRHGRRALVACCPPLARPQTLGPLADTLRQALGDDGARGLGLSALAGALRPLFPEWAARLPPAPEPAEDASAARYRVFAALAELLARMEAGLLVVEDVHWADEATLEFLLYLAARQPRPLSLVATCRPEDVPTRSLLPRLARLAAGTAGLRVPLGPLDLSGTRRLVSSMLDGEHISDEFAVFVHEHTDGVPLAAEELVRLMTARGDISSHEGAWRRRPVRHIDVPPAIRDAVLERAARLSCGAQAVLRAAAVLAGPAGEDLLAAVAGIGAGQVRAGLCDALDCGLLGEDGHGLVAFRHVLAARAVYEAVPRPDRRALHLRAGRTLEKLSPLPLAQLVRHFREAGETGKWSRYAEHTADLAVASGDEATAVALLHDLLTGAELPAKLVARLARKIPYAALSSPTLHRDLAAVLTRVLNARTLEPGEKGEVGFELGRLLIHMEEWAGGRAELERAIPLLGHDPAAACRAMMLLAWPRGTTCPAAVHLRWLHRAERLAAQMAPDDRLRFAVDRASALLLLGREQGWSAAAELPVTARNVSERQQIARAQLNIGDAAVRWGRYGEARHSLARALDLASSHGYAYINAVALDTQAHLDWFTGAWAGLAERAGSLAGNEDLPSAHRLEAMLVAGLLAAATNRMQADERLLIVLTGTQRIGMEFSMEAAAALASLRLAKGHVDDALEITRDPTGIAAAKEIWVWATDLVPTRVDALIAAGRAGEAAGLVTEFARGLRGRDAPAPKAALILCRAILAKASSDHARAAALFARAAAAWQALPRPYDALLARERQARCLLAAGRADTGLALLDEVQAGLSGLGATGDADRIARSLRGHGVAVPRVWRGGRHGYGDRLSPRELEVVQLAAAGRTTREIARELYRSPDTVYTQLRSAMRKLGVSSRAALAQLPDRGSPEAGQLSQSL